MESDLDKLITTITNHPLFLKLKTVIENNPYHTNEDVYSHSLKTKDIARQIISGNFITNPEAKKRYDTFVNEDVSGMKRKNVMVLIALLHDIGKILYVKEAGSIRPILETRTDSSTSCPGHEYWGSTIVGSLLKELHFPDELIRYIARVIALHDTYNDGYWSAKAVWPMPQLINDVKSRAETVSIEALFNIYCDNYTVAISAPSRELIQKIYNEPSLYDTRGYIIQ